MSTKTKTEFKGKQRVNKIEKLEPEPNQNKGAALRIGEKIKYGTHCSLAVTERAINGLMNAYKNIFVMNQDTDSHFYTDQGFNYFDKRDYENAIENFETSVDNGDSDNVEVLFHLGLAYINIESPAKALPYLKKAEKLENNDPDIASEIGSCFLKLEKYPQAIEYFKRSVKLVPDIASNYYLLGMAYEKNGQLKEAVDMYRKTIDLDPKDPIYYHALGFVFETMEKHSDAIACFKKAMELEKNR